MKPKKKEKKLQDLIVETFSTFIFNATLTYTHTRIKIKMKNRIVLHVKQ